MSSTYHPDLVAELSLHGWPAEDFNAPDKVIEGLPNPRFRHLVCAHPTHYVKWRGRWEAEPTPSDGLTRRIRLRVEVGGVKSVLIDLAKPHWRRSLARWVISACMQLAPRWQEED